MYQCNTSYYMVPMYMYVLLASTNYPERAKVVIKTNIHVVPHSRYYVHFINPKRWPGRLSRPSISPAAAPPPRKEASAFQSPGVARSDILHPVRGLAERQGFAEGFSSRRGGIPAFRSFRILRCTNLRFDSTRFLAEIQSEVFTFFRHLGLSGLSGPSLGSLRHLPSGHWSPYTLQANLKFCKVKFHYLKASR